MPVVEKCRVNVALWPGFNVTGVVIPDAVNSDPAIDKLETVTAAVPVDDNVIACVAVCPSITFPKLTVVELTVSVEVETFNCTLKLVVPYRAEAIRVAVCADVTAVAVAVNVALLAPAGTVIVAGSVMDVSLLARLTANPPLAAGALNETVQASVPAPEIDD